MLGSQLDWRAMLHLGSARASGVWAQRQRQAAWLVSKALPNMSHCMLAMQPCSYLAVVHAGLP